MTLTEKVAYLKGLADGMELDESKKENKLLLAVIDVLEEVGCSIEDLEDNADAMADEIDAISEDLADVEEIVYDEDEDEDEDDCCCDDDEIYEAKCPKCGELLEIGCEEFDQGFVVCRACGEKLEFETCEDEDDCCCDD